MVRVGGCCVLLLLAVEAALAFAGSGLAGCGGGLMRGSAGSKAGGGI